MGLHLIAEGFWSDPESYLAIFKVVIGLGFVIFVHELGHFLVAKACGVRCDKFYVGFDFFDIKIAGKVIIPRALIKFKRGETEYGIGIIPLGGYVKMLGQDDNPAKAAEEMEKAKVHKQKSADDGDSSADDETTDAEGEYELDPRSYQAKSVPQRMAIISAGVIMNLIFAVIFATIAYLIGVKYEPAEIGGTVAGGPAYEAGIVPGDRFLQLGRDGKPNEHLRFRDDLAQTVALHGDEEDFHVLVQHRNDSPPEWFAMRPSMTLLNIKGVSLSSIGVSPSLTSQLAENEPALPGLAAEKAGKFRGGDTVIAIDGEKVENVYDMKRILAQNSSKPLTFTVVRKKEKETDEEVTEDILVEPNVLRRTGLGMKMGSIVAVQKGSPADKAGFQKGDRIEMVDGKVVRNPLLLGDDLREAAAAGREIEVVVLRLRDDPQRAVRQTLKVTPRLPTSSDGYGSGHPIAIEELGVAVPVLNWVEHIEPGGPADKAGMKPGDKILSVEFVAADAEQKQTEESKLGLVHEPIEFDEDPLNWPAVHAMAQLKLPDTKIMLTYLQDGKQKTAELQTVESGEWGTYYMPTRGMKLQLVTEIHKADSLGEAFMLGLRQTKEDSTRVIGFLRKLVTGGISPTNLGGPGTIAVAATSEAKEDTTRLLLFLTLLSANLAVVNFLPIPVLDGGHMMFLLYEGIMRKPPSEKWFMRLTLVGFAFVLSLMLFVISLDVFRFSNWF